MTFKIKVILLLILASNSFSQNVISNDTENNQNNLQLNIPGQQTNLLPNSNLIASVDSSEYVIDAGDGFMIKIDREGPALRIFNSVVNPEGYVVFPDIKAVKVKNLLLKDAKKKILSDLKRKFPNSVVEVFLNNLHRINVTVIGSMSVNNQLVLQSSDRLYDLFSQLNSQNINFKNTKIDSLNSEAQKKISLRQVKIVRGRKDTNYDLLDFKLTGNIRENPYLRQNDIIIFPYKDTLAASIDVNGAVANPVQFEFKKGDNFAKAIVFAGGLLPNADSTKIELARFTDYSNYKYLTLAFPRDSNFILKMDDRIFARYKAEFHKKSRVKIVGEVSFPGEYPIEENKTRVADIIKLAGGFTSKASLTNSRIIAGGELFNDKELKRLTSVNNIQFLNKTEYSYLSLRTREDLNVINCDFENLFTNGDSSQNVLLHDGYKIEVPKKTKNIYVSGGVKDPGVFAFDPSWKYEDYIAAAGGFTDRAREGAVKVIKYKTGNWLEADDDDAILVENDVIFVPESKEYDWYEIFTDGLTVVSQIATLVLVYINITK